MASVGETRKLVQQIGQKLQSLERDLVNSTSKFGEVVKRAENILSGTTQSVEQETLASLRNATQAAEQAKLSVAKAITACQNYSDQTI